MLVFEAIEALKTSRLSIKNDIPLTSPQQDPKVRRLVQAVMVTCADLETYQMMTASQGRNLARLTLDLLDQNDKIFLSIAVVVFNKLACIVPGALDGLYERLMAFHFGPAYGSIFRQADALIRNELLAVIEHAQTNSNVNEWQQWVSALAWIGDEVAQRHLYRWLLEPSPYIGQPDLLPSLLYEAGWEFTDIGTRRDLYFPTCFTFVPNENTQGKHTSSVEVFVPREDRCGSCGRHLYTLFDIDLTDPTLAFLEAQGRRLRIALCPTCTPSGDHVFTDIDLDGFSQWSLSNGEEPVEPLEDLNDWEDFPELPSQALALGPLRRTPYEAYRSYHQEGLSQFGGFPTWVQHADYPSCPECQQTMLFVGQLSSIDLVAESEGIFYAFLCTACNKAATGFQNT